ncbi:uncharacterized protein MELLADRAFT_116739 [Melampsora larici-populina 98AG31]|uniref:SMP-LTD domain-containing protein n=1 Tax=Melampsora larici-populina (strain 98AG31 / pathotype 3-4-7) TaxID=747676 RepID=F4RNX4_MELLP|nr:uncharacterized protein MELLADRAFT_116739 [Melampsora larici-populina 98AG31]EGG05824.1 hypothetical protein MELLADRAFT_116739 [Melampsora larici-populina 98AG31]
MFYLLLFTYFLGAFTFLPALLIIVCSFIYFTSPYANLEGPTKAISISREETQESEKLNTKESVEQGLPKLYRAGWLTVRQTYDPVQAGDGTYMGMLTNSYRSFMDQRSKDPKRSRPKDQFYTVLKQNVLFLYEDEDQLDCAAAIEVTLYNTLLYPDAGPDGELYVKRRAICLRPQSQSLSNESTTKDTKCPESPTETEVLHERQIAGRPLPWFIFTKDNYEKEDWYHMLVASSKLSKPNAKSTFAKDTSLFDPEDMAKLVDSIDQQPDPIPMRWLNAMIGRIFLSAYRTSALETWIIDRIMNKLTRVKTPSFLSAIKVREVNVGSSTPFFSKPMLKELTGDGDASMEVHVNYQGEFRITVETVATINLSARFKPYVVNLVLAVVLKELEGNLLLKIKKPPTNRLWFGFTTMPRLVLQLDPVVSTRQIKWALILKPIESRIREVVLESIVLPHLDDLAFFDTRPYDHRGGIWGDTARKNETTSPADSPFGEKANEDSTEKISSPMSSHEGNSTVDPEHNHSVNASSTSREPASNLESLRQRTAHKDPQDVEEPSANKAPTSVTESNPLPVLSTNQEGKRNSWFLNSRRQESTFPPSQNSPRANAKPDSANVSAEFDGEALAKLKEVLRSRSESSRVVTPSLNFSSFSNDLSLPTIASPDAESLDPLASGSDETSPKLTLQPAFNHLSSSPTSNLIKPDTPHEITENIDVANETSKTPRRMPPPPSHRPLASPTNLPPPQRQLGTGLAKQPSEISLGSTLPGSNPTSILNQLRTRAADKEAIAASMSQAKNVVRKWGASWTAKRKQSQSTPYTNGFNPIPIDTLPEAIASRSSIHGSSAEAADEELHRSNSTKVNDTLLVDTLADGGEDGEVRSHQGQGARNEMMSLNEHRPSSIIATGSSSTSPELKAPELRHKTSTSRLSLAPSEENSAKRNRTIYTANGQFIPAAPQSTTGLSISSAQLVIKSDNIEPLTAGPASGSVMSQPSTSPAISTERSSYRPAPMMAIPGIKDSSHRFALGSDSVAQQLPQPEPKHFDPSTQSGLSNDRSDTLGLEGMSQPVSEVAPENSTGSPKLVGSSDHKSDVSPETSDAQIDQQKVMLTESSNSIPDQVDRDLIDLGGRSVEEAWGL